MRKGFWIAGGVVAGVLVIGGVTSGGTDDTSAVSESSASAEPEKTKSPAEEFKAFVQESGTANEKEAAKHVTKVQGADDQNDILDTAEIHTDYPAGSMLEHNGDAKLLASAFAEWRDSENGLVTVYDAGGESLANGNF